MSKYSSDFCKNMGSQYAPPFSQQWTRGITCEKEDRSTVRTRSPRGRFENSFQPSIVRTITNSSDFYLANPPSPPLFKTIQQRVYQEPVDRSRVVEGMLNEKRNGIDQTVRELLNALLQATCKVSVFRKFLEQHLTSLSEEERYILAMASIKEVAELKVLEKIKRNYGSQWNSRNSMEFLVKVFEILDSLGRTTFKIGSIFSFSLNEIFVCERCKRVSRYSYTFGGLQIVNFFHFEAIRTSNQQSYFNTKQSAAMKMQEQDLKRYENKLKSSIARKTLQQLLSDCCQINSKDLKECQMCHQIRNNLKLVELKPLSDGLIIMLPDKRWTEFEVSETLNLAHCSAICATFQLRAIVLPEGISNANNRWKCVGKLAELNKMRSQGPFLLFYEREESSALEPKISKTLVEKARIIIEKLKLSIRKFIFRMITQTTQEVMEDDMAFVKTSMTPQRPMKLPQDELFECKGRTAGLEVALRGLFTIQTFTAFLDKDVFLSAMQQAPDIHQYLNAIYIQHKKRLTWVAHLEKLMRLFPSAESSPREHILQLLSEYDRVPIKSRTDFYDLSYTVKEKLNEMRRGKCEALHDVFSMLMLNSTLREKWTYSRMLLIDHMPQYPSEQHSNKGSVFPSRPANVIDLETCIEQELLFNSTSYNTQQTKFQFLGSALIIRLIWNDDGRSHGLLRIPNLLDISRFSATAIPAYQLRAIVYYPGAENADVFLFQTISDSKSSHQILDRKCNAYMLFFEKIEPSFAQTTNTNTPAVSQQIPIDNRYQKNRQEKTEKGFKTCFRYGLQNLGNTCFMNAALNGLYSLCSFRGFFTKPAAGQYPLQRSLSEFCTKYTQGEVSSYLLEQLISPFSEFNDRRQHCANSYTFKLLIHLDQIMAVSSGKRLQRDMFGDKLRQYREGKCEPLHDIFSALVENLFICRDCFNIRRNFSYFRTVDVPIPSSAEAVNGMTVFNEVNFYPGDFANNYTGTKGSERVYQDIFSQVVERLRNRSQKGQRRNMDLSLCLEYMLRASLMSAENKMPCDNCGRETQHYKQSFFRQLSTALVIHFQRFDERTRQKLNTPIAFPMELDMSAYCGNDKRQYALRAVVYHKGLLDFGHYTAWINVGGRWYEADDYHVREGNSPPIENAYMLFYEEEAS